ncbi:FRG domain-containing protein [Microbacterium maritypicum]|uniref:FRG domain-containing protein n=1 Tax=Microbacterium maritypicum TaxID=33918 RepID=UPI003CF7C089
MLSVTEITVSSTTELTETVLSLVKEAEDDAPLWFRGQYSADWQLKSSLARSVTTSEQMFEKELRLLTRFRQRSLPFWPQGYPQDDWEHLFAMQHYGAPTRLLDWSENLFVGLYFSCTRGAYSKHSEVDDAANPVVWVLDPVGWNRGLGHLKDNASSVSILTTADDDELRPYSVSGRADFPRRYNAPVAIYGTHNSSRIVAQRGGFTIAGKSLDPMDSFAAEVGEKKLWKIKLLYSRDQMRRDLAVLGFAESMVFPDLVGLSREISESEGLHG